MSELLLIIVLVIACIVLKVLFGMMRKKYFGYKDHGLPVVLSGPPHVLTDEDYDDTRSYEPELLD